MQEIKALVASEHHTKKREKKKWCAFMNIYNTMEHEKVVWGFLQ